MKEPHTKKEKLLHYGPESGMGTGNGVDEALTGVRAGWVLSPEIKGNIPGADGLLFEEAGAEPKPALVVARNAAEEGGKIDEISAFLRGSFWRRRREGWACPLPQSRRY